MYEDERLSDGGDALYRARTMGVLRGINEVGQHRAAAAPVIRAIGRRNLAHSVGYPFVRGHKDFLCRAASTLLTLTRTAPARRR